MKSKELERKVKEYNKKERIGEKRERKLKLWKRRMGRKLREEREVVCENIELYIDKSREQRA